MRRSIKHWCARTGLKWSKCQEENTKRLSKTEEYVAGQYSKWRGKRCYLGTKSEQHYKSTMILFRTLICGAVNRVPLPTTSWKKSIITILYAFSQWKNCTLQASACCFCRKIYQNFLNRSGYCLITLSTEHKVPPVFRIFKTLLSPLFKMGHNVIELAAIQPQNTLWGLQAILYLSLNSFTVPVNESHPNTMMLTALFKSFVQC